MGGSNPRREGTPSFRYLAASALLVIIALGCRAASTPEGSGRTPRQPAGQKSLTVFVPCGLIIPFNSAVDEFRRLHPDIPVHGVYDNHLKLIARLEQGERADVFVSPGEAEMKYLESRNLLEPEPRVALGSYIVVLIAPLDNPAGIKSVADLASSRVKSVSFPDPEKNSVGYYAKQSLEKLGLWGKVQPKLRMVKSAKDAHGLVMRSEADAAFSFKTCPLPEDPAKVAATKVRIIQDLPSESYDTARIIVRLMRDAPSRQAALRFLEFLNQPSTHQVLLTNHLPDNRHLMSPKL